MGVGLRSSQGIAAIASCVAIISMAVFLPVNSASADGSSPTVSWASPNNDATVAGVVPLSAVAAPAASSTARILQWCLTRNGEPVADGNVGTFDGSYPSFDPTTGCWSITADQDAYVLNDATFTFDTIGWANASYAFVATVSDSSGRTASTPLTISTDNPLPTAAIKGIARSQTVRGPIALAAVISFPAYQTQVGVHVAKYCWRVDSGTCISHQKISVATQLIQSVPTSSNLRIISDRFSALALVIPPLAEPKRSAVDRAHDPRHAAGP
jgi:hypothetical protein